MTIAFYKRSEGMAMYVLLAANFLCSITLFVFGLKVQKSKTTFFIAGYSSMSEDEQARLDINTINKFIGRIMLMILSAIWLICGTLIVLGIFPFVVFVVSWLLFTITIFGGMAYMNYSHRFKRTQK